MTPLDQTAADALIEKIDKAILKHSVSNRDVAAVLAFLNYILKSGESDRFLRKDVEDTATGIIHFLEDITVSGETKTQNLHVPGNSNFGGYLTSERFISGFPGGSGWGLFIEQLLNAAGETSERSHLEIDDLTIRGRFRVYEMIISQLLGENGTRLTTDMMKVAGTDPDTGKILLDTEKGILYNPFHPGDILMVQRFGRNGIPDVKEYELQVVETGIGAGDSEDRQDWITYTNFVGDPTTIAAGDTLVRVDSVTDPDRKGIIKHTSVEPGSPYIDIITGMNTDPEKAVRSRYGRLDGLVTPAFGRLKGYGLYCDNIFATGDFRLRNGDDVLTRFEIMDGRISSEIDAVIDRFTQNDNFLRNAVFLNNMEYWEHPSDIITYKVGTEPVILNGNFFSEKKKMSEVVTFDKRLVLRIKKSYIKQLNKHLFKPESGRTLYLTVKYFCQTAGTLIAGFEGQELYVEESLETTTDYTEKVFSGSWDGTGDFLLAFSGDIYISVLALAYNALQDFIIHTNTRFEQTAESIKLLAESYETLHGSFIEHTSSFHVTPEAIEAMVERTTTLADNVDGIKQTIDTAGWITTADGNKLWATSETVDAIGNKVKSHDSQFEVVADQISGVVKSVSENAEGLKQLNEAGFITQADGNKWWASSELENGAKLISYINQTAEAVTINADKINLQGAVTFNSFNPDLQDTINNKEIAGTAQKLHDDIVSNLGTLAYNSEVSKAMLDETIITGGYIRTELIDVDSIYARQATIGDFQIQNGSIVSKPDAYSYEQARFIMNAKGLAYLGFLSKSAWVGIGLSTTPVSGGFQALGRFESYENDNWGMKLGLYIDVGNSSFGRNYGVYSQQACLTKESFISLGCKKIIITGDGYQMDIARYSQFVFQSTSNYNVFLPSKSSVLQKFNLTEFPADWGLRFSITMQQDSESINFKPPKDESLGIMHWDGGVFSDYEMARGDTVEFLLFENYYRIISRIQ